MYTIQEMLLVAFAIGLTGALTPGPTLIATIRASVEYGWYAGPLITAGHCLVEFIVFILILAGLIAVAGQYSWVIATFGGIALVIFGILTIIGSRTISLSGSMRCSPGEVNPACGPSGGHGIGQLFFSGVLTSIANPYFWVWWLSIGSAMVVAGLEGGLVLGAAFLVGHWVADITWYTIISVTVHRGRAVLSDRWYHVIIAVCGAFLVVFGLWFFSVAISR
ncbi:MAG: LysE family translocator [Methanoregulaceae archaeon]|nr:LysE family translocator [Methanoregulaceae archaeon]